MLSILKIKITRLLAVPGKGDNIFDYIYLKFLIKSTHIL